MRDITILKKYLQKNRDIYSQLSLFEYKCEGDTATLTSSRLFFSQSYVLGFVLSVKMNLV